jgi:acyl CoA:acetate/3-ketoacid CoA transferase beta subunit
LNAALEGAWADGGDPRVILVGALQKRAIDQFTGVATRFIDTAPNKQAPIVGAANMYVSSFGTHMVVLSRYVRSSVVLCIDPDYWAVAFLRGFAKRPLARTGEADKTLISTEFTLVCRNNAANAKVVSCA